MPSFLHGLVEHEPMFTVVVDGVGIDVVVVPVVVVSKTSQLFPTVFKGHKQI